MLKVVVYVICDLDDVQSFLTVNVKVEINFKNFIKKVKMLKG
jgi:hypothetical protein